ncbi:AEC family transporter [Mycoplasma sp. CSL7475-4]|uniref:AEC family transporter n=1 Tax=Mycoplasma sp. CSL7475-4 TaxID=2973942 RepID=UPI00216B3F80|nr:AEC family transporter [Mycoplasma sp. CSL7475-4]MCS4536584.1 AEC family transporter [Mycoplasma sp. CSL7475-4]
MQHLIKILSSQGLYGAVLATLTFVLIGFFVTKKGIFNKEINGKLSKFLLDFALPFLCLVAFMKDANAKIGKEVGIVIGLSAAFYILIGVYNTLIIKFVPKLISRKLHAQAIRMWERTDGSQSQAKFKEAYVNSYAQKLLTAQMMIGYASLQFFAVPLVQALGSEVFGGFSQGLLQVWNLPYMIGAFSYVKIAYSGQKMSKDQVKPIIKALTTPMLIVLYTSMLLWLIQFIPGPNTYFVTSAAQPFNFAKATTGGHQFWGGLLARFPVLTAIILPGVQIISPLAWIVIGGSLASSDIKAAARDKDVWITTLRKLVVMPLVVFLITLILVRTKSIQVSTGTLLVVLASCPPAAVCIIFSVAYKHEHTGFTAQVSSLTTLLCLVTMPIWTVVAHTVFKLLG